MKQPVLIGIINLTPDSFSGDGRLSDAAIPHAKAMIKDGADMLDIGAESTRPGATPLTAVQEWNRLQPFLRAYREKTPLSIDTRHPEIAAQAMRAGVKMINDVAGLSAPKMLETLVDGTCDIIVMHSLSIPADPNIVWPENLDPVNEILAWKETILSRTKAAGIDAARLIFDPGLGFGKTPEQSVALILRAGELKASGGRWLFGHSRKSFLKLFTDAPPEARDEATFAFSAILADAGIDYLRIHNVALHKELFKPLCT